jgi:uncharacterized HhH-GPD family protein
MGLVLSQQPAADALLDRDPLALLIGMVLDQQFPLERAFFAPYGLVQRLGRDLDVHELAGYDPEALAAVFAKTPVLHRFPKAMAKRVQELCRLLVERYDGDAAAVWREAPDGAELLRRVAELPGFGKQKAQIFVALLGKQYGVQSPGWAEAAGPFGQPGSYLSVADIVDGESLRRVREHKQQLKAAAKAGAPATKATAGTAARSRAKAPAKAPARTATKAPAKAGAKTTAKVSPKAEAAVKSVARTAARAAEVSPKAAAKVPAEAAVKSDARTAARAAQVSPKAAAKVPAKAPVKSGARTGAKAAVEVSARPPAKGAAKAPTKAAVKAPGVGAAKAAGAAKAPAKARAKTTSAAAKAPATAGAKTASVRGSS